MIILVQSKGCLNSSTCATEQILFCQNTPRTKSIEYHHQEKLVRNEYSYQFYLPDDHLEQMQPCLMISALNPFCFTVQFQQVAMEFDKFQREINDFYNCRDEKEYFLTPEDIQIYMCVICLDPKSTEEKKIWNRSQILDYNPLDKTVNLFYVDLGTWDEYVPIDHLRYLTERFHQRMVSSVTCRLARIHPINEENDSFTWTDDATNQFLAVIEHNTLQIQFLTVNSNGSFNTNLYVNSANQNVCVNDYLVHIKQAKPIEHDDDTSHSERHFHEEDSSIHLVIGLYNRFGEILQQSLDESRSTSMSHSSIPSPSTSTRSSAKLKHVDINTNSLDNDEQQIIPMIFVQYQKSILIPEFNIVTLLKLIDSSFDRQTVQRYVSRILLSPISFRFVFLK